MNKTIIGAWALSLGVTFYLGYSVKDTTVGEGQDSIHSAAKEGTQNRREKASGLSGDKKAVTNKRIHASSTKNRRPVNVVLADLKALLGDSGMMTMDMSSLAESYNLVKNLNEEELIEALNQLQGNLNHPSNMMPLMLLLGQYAEINPLNAMAFYESSITSPQAKMVALSGILSSWSKNDPEGAYEWYQEKGDKDSSGGMMGGSSVGLIYIFQGLAKKDLNSTIEKLKSLGSTGFKAQMAASGIASSLRSKEDFVEFIEKTKDLDNKQVKRSVLQNWVLRDPAEAVEWVDSLESEDEKKSYRKQVLSSWMMSNPVEAADWYLAKSEGKEKQASADKVVQQWSYSNPKAALEWVNNQDGLDSQKSIKKIFESASYNNPVFVADNLDQLSDDSVKQDMSQKVYTTLLRQDKKKAADFLEKSPYKDNLKDNSKIAETSEVILPIQ